MLLMLFARRCLSSLEKAHQHDTHDADKMAEQDSYSDTQRASESLKQVFVMIAKYWFNYCNYHTFYFYFYFLLSSLIVDNQCSVSSSVKRKIICLFCALNVGASSSVLALPDSTKGRYPICHEFRIRLVEYLFRPKPHDTYRMEDSGRRWSFRFAEW